VYSSTILLSCYYESTGTEGRDFVISEKSLSPCACPIAREIAASEMSRDRQAH